MVGTSDPGMVLRLRGNYCCARNAEFVREMPQLEVETGSRCSGYVVLVRALAVYCVGLAGSDARPASLLSNVATDYRLRHFIFLGCTDGNAGVLVHGAAGEARTGPARHPSLHT